MDMLAEFKPNAPLRSFDSGLVQCLGFVLNMMKQHLATELPAASNYFKKISDVSKK